MNAFGIASYGIAALSFLVLTLLLITAWRGRQQGAHLIVASAMTAIWAIVLAAQSYTGAVPVLLIYLAEALRGEMSFVGPRPERPEFVGQLEERIPYYRERHTIKPGITGWAQLCYPYGSSEQDATEKLQYDLFYVKNHSLLFYLAILVQTVEVIVWRKGAR